ncbi:MAG: AfsR/SARP family transcriptional regulator [Actinobacteria bacterium]|nr:AfsR/SARP family transcriptional regulator [Actinomycetota bacterium]
MSPLSPIDVDAGGRPGNLPAPTELIGRASLVAQITETVGDAPVVTLIGPGGVGKTSVAMAAASGLAPGYRDGAWWCELASLDAGGAVTEMVMTVLDAQLRPGMAPVSGVVDYLRHQRALLVLDNAEHVVDNVGALVTALVRDCPGVRVLVTSRERIGAPSEQVIAVPPLAVPPPGTIPDAARAEAVPAIALFTRRAAAAGPFTLTDANYETVADICRRLDGVPLALELAATRMRSMGPDDLVDRLTWRFRVLRGARGGGVERHRTLRAVVDWSYDLLDPRAQRVFERLSVFAGDVTLAAVEQVVAMAGDDVELPDVADVIADLVDASMVVASTGDGAARYSLLETLRAYGRERLAASGHEPATRRAHARYFVELAESTADGLYDADNPARVAVLDQVIDELRAAHAWACANDLDLALRLVSALPIYAEQRAHGEAFSWAERTIERAEQVASRSAWLVDAYGAAALSARFRGDLAQATTYADRGLAGATGPRDPGGAIALYTLAEIALYEGRLEDVRWLSTRLRRLPLRRGHRALLTWSRVSELLVQAYQGAGPVAVAAAEQMLATAHRDDDHAATAWALYCLAEALADIDPPRAMAIAEQTLTRSRALDERFLTGVALVTVASLHARHGDATLAVPLFREIVDRWHRAGNWTQQWIAARSIVGLLVRLGANEQAATLHGALSARTTATEPWGADADRLAAADATLAERLPPGQRAAARERGAAMRDDEVIAWMRTVLDDLGDR